MPTVIKDRIYALGGKLNYVDLAASGPYKTPATDVRFIKFDKSQVTMRLVWEAGAKVSDLVKKYGADYGINAPFFWDEKPIADCISDGKIINEGYDNQTTWHGFAVKNGIPQLGYFEPRGGFDLLIKTTPYLISNGNPVWDFYRVQEKTAPDIGKDMGGNYVRANRTFIGLDANGDILVAVSDGRSSTDRGLTLEEMSLYMQDKGAVNALNFDGGSSCVIADKTGMLNDQGLVGEKAVNHALLFFIKPAPTPAPTVDYQQEGFNYLVDKFNLDASQHTPTDPVTVGLLGQLLKRKGL